MKRGWILKIFVLVCLVYFSYPIFVQAQEEAEAPQEAAADPTQFQQTMSKIKDHMKSLYDNSEGNDFEPLACESQKTNLNQPDYPQIKEIYDLLLGCWQEYDKAIDNVCNPQKNNEIMQGTVMIDTLIQGMAMTTSYSQEQACGTMGKIAVLANGAMAAFKTSCMVQQSGCISSCSKVNSAIRKQIPKNDLACNKLQLNFSDNNFALDNLESCFNQAMGQIAQVGLTDGRYRSFTLLPECSGIEPLIQAASNNIAVACNLYKAGYLSENYNSICQGAAANVSGLNYSTYTQFFSSSVIQNPNRDCSDHLASLTDSLEDNECSSKVAHGRCISITDTIGRVATNMMSLFTAQMAANQCEKDSQAKNKSFCDRYPDDPYCKGNDVDCNDPLNKHMRVCICQANPRDPICGSGTVASKTGTFDGGSSSGVGGTSASELLKVLDEGKIDPNEDLGGSSFGENVGHLKSENPGRGSSYTGGGGGGPGLSGGGGSGNAPARPGGGGGSGGYRDDLVQGATASRGGGQIGGQRRQGDNRQNFNLNNPNQKVNLKDFLPGGKQDPTRGVASKGSDGITGAKGPSIWEKVSGRYRMNRGKLLP